MARHLRETQNQREWENEHIKSNLVSLLENIDSNKILSFLLQSRIISDSENDNLEIIGRQTGRREQTKKLLDIIRTRIDGYRQLAKSLYHSRQTDAWITLLYGIQANTLENPFRYCEIELNMAEILTRKVTFEGNQIKLGEICKHWNSRQIISLREMIDVSIYKSLFGKDEVVIARETIPSVIPYYIKRTLTQRRKLDTKIFVDQQQDIFLIQNIEAHQLTRLAQMSKLKKTTRPSSHISRPQKEDAVSTGISSEQMFDLTTRFILLENEQHYDGIHNRAKGKRVHFIKFLDSCYFLERSTNPHDIKKYILDDELQIPEHEFLTSVSRCDPIIIYDTPGMGKSVLLANLARQFKLQNPTENVVFFQMRDLVDKLLVRNSSIDISLIESVIMDIISTNKFGSFINIELFTRPFRLNHLFLDAFDEVGSNHRDVAIRIIKALCGHKQSYKIHITSRPHQGDILERICSVISHGIRPLQTEEQVGFMVEYWQNQYNVEKSKEVVEFAKNCLSRFRHKISSKERDITGIPLQCRMLADVYTVHAQTNSFSLRNSNLAMNNIYDMYREFFSLKFPQTQLKLGKCELLNLHFKLALDLLFPAYAVKLYPWPEYNCHKEIFSVGIIEMSKSGKEQFVHRTFAEFLVAEFTASLMDIEHLDAEIQTDDFLKFFIFGVLESVELELELNFYSRFGDDRNCKFVCNASRFQFPVLTFFLGHIISFNKLDHIIVALLKGVKDANILPSSKKCNDLLVAGLENNSIGLFTLLKNLPREYFSDYMNKNMVIKVTLGFGTPKMSNLSNAEINLIVGTHLCSLDVLKQSFSFVSSLIENRISSLEYEAEDYIYLFSFHPILVSAQRGNYHIFEFVFDFFAPVKLGLVQTVYNCLNNSYSNSQNIVQDKIQIIKLLLSNHSSMLNADITNVSLFECAKVHLDLILFLFAQGIDALATDSDGETVAHMVASYFSADEYHKFVEFLIEHGYFSIFNVKTRPCNSVLFGHETAVHFALKNIEIKNKTLEVLANRCKATFNEKDKQGITELVSAIYGGRSVSLLQRLVELGADIKILDNKGCTVLCHAIQSDNIEALKYFLSLGVGPNIRCNRYFSNIWEHVLERKSSIVSDMAVLLIQNGAEINSATNLNEIDLEDFSTLVYRPASVKLKQLQLKEECVDIINEKCTVGCNASSCMFTLCCCMAHSSYWSLYYCCCCCGCKPCDYCEDNDLCCC